MPSVFILYAAVALLPVAATSAQAASTTADCVVINARYITRVAPESIVGTTVLPTFIDGQPVYQKSK